MKFIDEAEIHVRAGDGGRGCMAFLREKYRPHGGPSGGDGGDGGDVVFVVDPGLTTLLDFKFQSIITAGRGEHGRGKEQYGKRGTDQVVRVPTGTIVRAADSGEVIADLRTPHERCVIARGGRGGKGNMHFATSTNQAPRFTIPATPGEERRLKLELQLMADVGLVGYPNVGKSTVITKVSAARPRIADYPFTTLVPHLGVVRIADEASFVLADIPGLIEGAHRGLGLGDRFLRHVSRTSLLIHLIDISTLTGRDPLADYDAINHELHAFDAALAAKPQVVVGNKLDLAEARAAFPAFRARFAERGVELWGISAATGEGVAALMRHVFLQWRAVRAAASEQTSVQGDRRDTAMSEQLAHKRRLLPRVRRVVIKIGSSILSGDDGINRARLRVLAEEICGVHHRGIEVVVVSSGAVAAGMARLGMKERPKTVPQRQAAAAVGQIDLMALYEEYFATFACQVAQILLTHDDLANRSRYLNARHTIETLIAARVIPVANENDTVVTDELRNFGDNDNLSALIAGLVEADVLVLLSDVAGLYTKNPRTHADAQLIDVVADVAQATSAIVMDGHGPLGTGGMASKLAAAQKAVHAGIPTVIADGLCPGVLPAVFDVHHVIGTLILAEGDRLARRKHWIAYTLKPSGTVVVDQGAYEAITQRGRSLLPKGLKEVQGKFSSGECVRCVDPSGREFARGLVNYSAAELEKIKGTHSGSIESVLGYTLADEVIHRKDLVLTSA